MPLPELPKLEDIVDPEDPQSLYKLQRNIEAIHIFLGRFRTGFANFTGEAIDPTATGRQASFALDMLSAPTVTYLPGLTQNASDGGIEGFIDVSYVLPARATGCIIYYGESTSVFFQAVFNARPSGSGRILGLKAGVTYVVKAQSIAANNGLGPESSTSNVVIPFFDGYNTVDAVSLTGTGAAIETQVQTLTYAHGLDRTPRVNLILDSIAGEAPLPSLAQFIGVFLLACDDTDITVRVVGLFINSATNIGASLQIKYL